MTTSPLIGVLALQGDVKEHEIALQAVRARTIRVRSAEDLSGIDGLVIPGGESTTMSNLAIRAGLFEPLRAASSAGLPMYGSCAGMIMLADRVTDARPDQETIGGLDVTVRRNAFGRQVDSFEIDLDVPVVGTTPFKAVFIRAPLVESTGPEVEVLSTLRRNGAAGTIVAVRQGVRLATSFHPELTGDTRIHELFVQIVRQHS
ncbi:MAG: pyridoxal 5'-phosphate synthase glutaminase subunit PdxT [Actinomycetes bacterium]